MVNPNIVEQQIESNIIFGLQVALYGEITLKDGRVQQTNFHDFQPAAHAGDAEDRVLLHRAEHREAGRHRRAGHGAVLAGAGECALHASPASASRKMPFTLACNALQLLGQGRPASAGFLFFFFLLFPATSSAPRTTNQGKALGGRPRPEDADRRRSGLRL